MADRKPIPSDVQARILVQSARRCCICYGINKDFLEKKGQIAHIDQNPSNPDFDNLAFLCFDHHDQFDSKTKQSKNLTSGEIKYYRAVLYEAIKKWQTDGTNPVINENQELLFDAGPRIKHVREEIRLSTSKFAELVSVASQREYESMENGSKEVSLRVLSRISETCGVNLEWLKHQEGRRYLVEDISFHPRENPLEYIASLKPQEIFLTADAKGDHHVGLVVQTGDFRYQVIDTEVTLDFEYWVERHWVAPRFYDFLQVLSNSWKNIDGFVLPSKYEKELYGGNIHFLVASRNASRYGRDLLYDILDINEVRKKLFLTYSKAYGGNWMHQVHIGYKKIVDTIELDNDFENMLLVNLEYLSSKGFDCSYIKDEITQSGGVFAAKRLLYREKGVTELLKLKELDLLGSSMEALVIQKKFQSLFSSTEINECKRRLVELGQIQKGK